jgi:hypothetical protein
VAARDLLVVFVARSGIARVQAAAQRRRDGSWKTRRGAEVNAAGQAATLRSRRVHGSIPLGQVRASFEIEQ